MRRFFVVWLLLLGSAWAVADETINVMFYNVENLFDTVDDPEKEDEEYLPSSARRWTQNRFQEKISNICRVIAAADPENAPEIIGMAEVENDSVIDYLTRRSPLRNIGYDYVVTNSPDKRGIDVALLYKRSYFRLLSTESLRVDLSPMSSSPTRDILHVTGKVATGDTVDILVCHWPSRSTGVERTEPLRVRAAHVAAGRISEIISQRRKPYVILMGDLNEGPDERAVRTGLNAAPKSLGANSVDSELVTLMDDMPDGSYRYNGEWDKYDQFVVSASFLNGLGCLEITDARICRFGFLLQEDKTYGGQKPFRAYNGYRYQGGYSDHLPIVLDISY